MDSSTVYLVTGVAGFIGYHVATKLLEQGHTIIGCDNLNDYYSVMLKKARLEQLQKSKLFSFYKADLSNKKAIEQIFQENMPRIVIHLAAQAGVRYSLSHPETYIQSNLVGFANILECCRYGKVEHLLYASSSSVYGSNHSLPFSEEDRVDHPISLYAATKKSNELMAHSYSHLFGLPTTGMRFFTVYGPWGRPDMSAYLFADAIINGLPIKVFNHGHMLRDFTYIDDIVCGVLALVSKSRALKTQETPYFIYNIGNNHPEKLVDFITYIEDNLGVVAQKEYLPMQPGDVPSTYANIDALSEDTGFHPKTSLKDGIGKFITWYRKYHKL